MLTIQEYHNLIDLENMNNYNLFLKEISSLLETKARNPLTLLYVTLRIF